MKTAHILTNKPDPLSKEENASIVEEDIIFYGAAISYGIPEDELSQDDRLGTS